MTRREFIGAAALTARATAAQGPLAVPVHLVRDSRSKLTPAQARRFSTALWPQAVRDFARGGIRLQWTEGTGEIRRSPADRPIIAGVRRGSVNVIVTDHVPMYWDRGRSVPGLTTLYDGYCISVIAVPYAHGDQVPFLSVNTCVHELLHALLQDIFVSHPRWYQVDEREARIDWYATRLWLFGDGAAVRKSAQGYIARLRSGTGA